MMEKQIKKEQIIQLREHDLNRGHNKSRTPVYPVTVPEAIIGLNNTGGVTIVTSLPEEGEMGKIYFNNEDDKYYGYDGNQFTEFGASAMPVVHVRKITPSGPEEYNLYNTHTLEPNVYYVLPDVIVSDDPLVVKSNILTLNLEDMDMNFANQYICRVKALQDDMSIVLPSGIYFADNNPSIEAGHTYEINILYDTCLIADITHS